jgi:hypothetical protein
MGLQPSDRVESIRLDEFRIWKLVLVAFAITALHSMCSKPGHEIIDSEDWHSFLFFSTEIERFWLPNLESKPSHNMTLSFTLLIVYQILALVGITAAKNHVFDNTGFSIQSQKARIRVNEEFPIQQNRAGPLPNVIYWPALTGGLKVGDISLESSQNLVFFLSSLASKGSATKKGLVSSRDFQSDAFSFFADGEQSTKSTWLCFPAPKFPEFTPAVARFTQCIPPDKFIPFEIFSPYCLFNWDFLSFQVWSGSETQILHWCRDLRNRFFQDS